MKRILPFLFAFLLLAEYTLAEHDLSEFYDENTEITISGKIIEVLAPKRGPILLKIKPNRKEYFIVTAPPWFLRQQEIVFNRGIYIEVKGSKFFSKEGNVYIIGKELRLDQDRRRIILRDIHSRPLWRGQGMNRR